MSVISELLERALKANPSRVGELMEEAVNPKRIPSTMRDVMAAENPNFRRWFGESKVVNPHTGLPQTVMHATDASESEIVGEWGKPTLRIKKTPTDFHTFRMPKEGEGQLGIHVGVDPRQGDRFASWLTSPEETVNMMEAVDYAQNLRRSMPSDDSVKNLYERLIDEDIESMMKGGGRNMPLYIRAENPLRLSDYGGWSGRSMKTSMTEMAPDLASKFESQYGPIAQAKESTLRKFLLGEGFDSVVYRNRYEGVPETAYNQLSPKGPVKYLPESEWAKTPTGDSYILFSPRQIKSAIGNVGTYRRNTGNINYGLLMSLLGGGAAMGMNNQLTDGTDVAGA